MAHHLACHSDCEEGMRGEERGGGSLSRGYIANDPLTGLSVRP